MYTIFGTYYSFEMTVSCSVWIASHSSPSRSKDTHLKRISIHISLYRFQNAFLRCPTPRLHCFLSSHWPSLRFLSFVAFLKKNNKYQMLYYIQLYLLIMDLDTPETCRGWRNILRISCVSSWFFFTRLFWTLVCYSKYFYYFWYSTWLII
jgi:hypothetical protein